ncbi:MAG: hypothetical protein KF883_06555 [Thermomicrobiales bacterium]|nr:hypothetical protein [Thermomicrobiales bacterium]
MARLLIVACLLLATVGVIAQPGSAESQEQWWDDAVCYEIFVRSFQDSDGDGIGDLAGLISRLDYLNDGEPGGSDLGVTCIWLMPVFPSPSYHGYDVTDYYDVDPDYGTLEEMDALIAAAADRGVRVLLDVPINHTSNEHPWFLAAADRDPSFRDWYSWSDDKPAWGGPSGERVWHQSPADESWYYGFFGEHMPDLNLANPDVTAEIERISAFWLDRGVAGFRIDAAKHLIEEEQNQENTPSTHAWLEQYRQFLDESYPDAFLIGEIFGAGAFVLAPYYDPEQLHAYFQFDIAYQILTAAGGGGAGGIRSVVRDALEGSPGQEWGTFLTNHDQNRVMVELDGDLAEAKLAAIALLTLPGLPFIYYGEEIGMWGSKPDEQIRSPMQWSRDPATGFTAGTPWQPFQADAGWVTVENQSGDPYSLLSLYQRLIDLHTSRPSIAHGSFVAATGTTSNLLAYLRVAGDEVTLVILNFGRDAVELEPLTFGTDDLASGTYGVDTLLGGLPVADVNVVDGVIQFGAGSRVTLAAQSALVLDVSVLGLDASPVASPSAP